MAAALLCMTARGFCAAETDGFRTVDLSAFSATERESRELPALPAGLRNFNHVPFRTGHPIAVTGIDSARTGDFFPTEVNGIRVGGKARRIHLLHTTLFAEKDGVPLASIVFHFADGQTQAVRLGYGVHVRNWTTPRLEKTDALLDPNSRLAASEGDERRGDSSRVFQTALENPRPAEPIASLDVVSLFSHATPVILAITL